MLNYRNRIIIQYIDYFAVAFGIVSCMFGITAGVYVYMSVFHSMNEYMISANAAFFIYILMVFMYNVCSALSFHVSIMNQKNTIYRQAKTLLHQQGARRDTIHMMQQMINRAEVTADLDYVDNLLKRNKEKLANIDAFLQNNSTRF